MALTSKNPPLSSPEAQLIFDDLKAEGYKTFVSKKQYAEIIGCSISSVDHYMSRGLGLPPYRKLGGARNARVAFGLRDIAEYLASQMVKTA